NYVCQKYVSSRTKQGDPFDCRIHVQKAEKGEWAVLKNYIRIGIGQKVISNVNQGGGISDLVPFLKANFENQWKEISKDIKELTETLPSKIESLIDSPTMAFGFDIAITRNGELYLFEANRAPAVKTVLARTSRLRIQYYEYMLNNIVDKNKLIKVNKAHSKILKKHVGDVQDKINRIENQIAALSRREISIKRNITR